MVLPVHDENPLRRTPWVTYALVAANVIVLLLTPASRVSVTGPSAQAQLCSQTAFYDRYAAIPRELTTNRQLPQVATGQPGPRPDTCYVGRPAYHKEPALSVLFAMFLHAGWLHLLGNMLFLWIFGVNVEDILGHAVFLLFYLLCGIIASMAHVAWVMTFDGFTSESALIPSLGASGAISGVLGAYFLFFPTRPVLVLLFRFLTWVPAYVAIGIWFVFQLINGLGMLGEGSQATGVAYAAHIGGFAAGAVMGSVWLLTGQKLPGPETWRGPRYYPRRW